LEPTAQPLRTEETANRVPVCRKRKLEDTTKKEVPVHAPGVKQATRSKWRGMMPPPGSDTRYFGSDGCKRQNILVALGNPREEDLPR